MSWEIPLLASMSQFMPAFYGLLQPPAKIQDINMGRIYKINQKINISNSSEN